MNKQYVGDGKVELIAGGGKIYTDIAARFVRSEKTLKEITASPYNKELVKTILDSGHEAAVEFDYFLFAVEGYSRVTETQLVRKRLASYMIKSGRVDKDGKRSFDVVVPKSIENVMIPFICDDINDGGKVEVLIDTQDLLNIIEQWYDAGVKKGVPEEDLRYLKPQATEFKGLIGMNAHALRDWFRIRCCKNAQTEIRDMANKMLKLCKKVAPDLFADAGPNCVRQGYCPENDLQHPDCQNKIYTKEKALSILSDIRKLDKALEK